MAYGFAAAFGAGETCERQVLDQLADLERHALEYLRRDGLMAGDELFYAEQNARTVRDAATYYRAMFSGRVSSWNLRDRHMADSLDALAEHLSHQRGEPAKIVVWAHNSHLGDARATEVAARGELNLGQLVRERRGTDCRLIGFTTYTGTVTAADDWGAPADRKWVRPALADSVEELFHEAGEKAFLLDLGTRSRCVRGAAQGATGTGDRGHLPAGDRAAEPLLPHRCAVLRPAPASGPGGGDAADAGTIMWTSVWCGGDSASLRFGYADHDAQHRSVSSVPDNEQVDAWIAAYIRAWNSNDPDEIAALFTEDAEYRTAPFEAPWRGRARIVEQWLDRKDERGQTEFDWEPLTVTPDLAIVQGTTVYRNPPNTYSNLWVIRLAPDGRCREFTEWWMEHRAGTTPEPGGDNT